MCMGGWITIELKSLGEGVVRQIGGGGVNENLISWWSEYNN